MNFKLYTLTDISRTDARRGDDLTKYQKQQNYLTTINTIGLRANPTIKKYPQIVESHPKFGSFYKGSNNVWMLEFEIEYESAHSIELLENDFNLVPFFVGLEESVNFNVPAFITQDNKFKNIVFELNE